MAYHEWRLVLIYRRQLLVCLILTFASATRIEAGVFAEVSFQGSGTTTFTKTTTPFFIEQGGGENCCGDGYGLVDLSKPKLKAEISSRRPTPGGTESQFEVVALGSDDFSVEGTQIVNGVQVPLSTGDPLPQPVTLLITVRLKGLCPPLPEGISGNVTGAAELTVGLNHDIKRFSSTAAADYIPVVADQEFDVYLGASHSFTTVGVIPLTYSLHLFAASGTSFKFVKTVVTPTLPAQFKCRTVLKS
jgi:hypothetical protein